MSHLKVIATVGVAGVAGVLGSHSRWGPKYRAAIDEFHRPSYNPLPPEWKGASFKPKLDFPTTLPSAEERPWEKIDFRKEPEAFLRAVLEYCFDGNIENDFVPQRNPKRQWFHAPWMCQTTLGREPIHGLTFERPAPPGYLADQQQRVTQIWAIGLHNERGAYAFGRVWKRQYKPAPINVQFPSGTVSFKLIFTEATPSDVPFLNGSPTWKATISKKPLPYPSKKRVSPIDLHLLQVDIAVRDTRADDTTGWLYGTFMYHDSVQEKNPWYRLMPVSLMWGNDPGLTPEKYNKGERPKESWVNPKAVATLPESRPFFGWLGRANGPVDNFKSSCHSCHSTANHPTLPMYPWEETRIEKIMHWFRHVKAGEKFGSSGHSLDYSLQMAVGLDNYERWSKCWVPRFFPVHQSSHSSKFPEQKLASISDYKAEHMDHIAPEEK